MSWLLWKCSCYELRKNWSNFISAVYFFLWRKLLHSFDYLYYIQSLYRLLVPQHTPPVRTALQGISQIMNRQLHMPKKHNELYVRYCVCLSVCVSLFDPCASMCVNALRFQWPPAHYLPLTPTSPPSTHAWEFSLTCRIALATFCTVSWAAYLYLPCAVCIFYLQRERERKREKEEWEGKRQWGRGVGKHSVFSSVMFERWLSTDRSLFTAIQTSLRCSPCIYDDDICIWLEWVFNFNFGFNSNFNIEPAHRATLK